ncbi:MAG: hypothetical protein AMS22_05865 [Thiotrichales bacterium SG8_50]|nr:MAG: hypothetical protein AMS22_05865 [Thiotrichales bacterium SG8_50]
MKNRLIKISGLIALVLTIAVGCASAPEEPAPTGPTAADAEAAIAAAKSANKQAGAMGAEWRDTGKLIKQAEEALAAGDYAKAIALADEARAQAEMAMDQKRAEDARYDARFAASQVEAAPAMDSYTVQRGDSLWRISGKGDVYGDPYQWPLIFKANRDKIKDADLIYPEQQFDIQRGAGQGEVDAAVRHARTRGAWSLGAVEASDQAYLSGN